MTQTRVTLESFEPDGVASFSEGADYKRGLADGLKQGETTQSAATAQALEAISSTLTDMAFGYEEARLHVLERLRPLIGQLAYSILPQIAQESFAAHLTEVVEDAFGTATGVPVEISVSPDMMTQLNNAQFAEQFRFVSDPVLGPGQALIGQGDAHVLLDLTALTAALQSALNGLESPERTQSHG